MPTVRPHHIISVLAFGGIVLAAVNFNSQPLFQNTDNFVLFAQEEIKLEQGVQISSGDLGSNKKIDIEKDAIINGNLFADRISIDKNTTINGNASFNKLQIKKESEILGTQTKPIQLPIVNLPEIPEFTIGTQDFKFEGENNTLPSGNYRNITIEKNSNGIETIPIDISDVTNDISQGANFKLPKFVNLVVKENINITIRVIRKDNNSKITN